MRTSIYIFLIMAILLPVLNAQSEEDQQTEKRNRALLFEFGGGFGTISYDNDTDTIIREDFLTVAEWDRITVPVHFLFGVSIFHRDYITMGIDGIMDRLWKDSSYYQLNTVLYFLGYKYYPFTTGLYIEPRLGISHLIVDIDGDREFSDIKAGASFTIAYDFAMQETGVSASLGLIGMICMADEEFVEDKILTSGGICVSLLIK